MLAVPPIKTWADITDQKVGTNAVSNAPIASATIPPAVINARLDRKRSIPAEMAPSARNQLRIKARWRRMVLATFFMGSIFDRIVHVHHSSRNLAALVGYGEPDFYTGREAIEQVTEAFRLFGRFPDQLRRLILLWRKRPRHAALVKDFAPSRLVEWLQEIESLPEREGRSLYPSRLPASKWCGSEKETLLLVGATPEAIRKHYERMDRMVVAKRAIERRLAAGVSVDGRSPTVPNFPCRVFRGLDEQSEVA
jgi:hypothetical protein